MNFIVATFYHFVELPNYYDMKDEIKAACDNFELKGTILLAEEGINGTISGERSSIDKIFDFLYSDERLKYLSWKESFAKYQPFSKMKVRLKREIVNFGISSLNTYLRGEYVDPEYWDDFISQPNILVVDSRNEYEVKLGKFKNAVDPHIQYFRDFPQWVKSFPVSKDMKIAMYCTGGVRCEKSSSYMKSLGFRYVYHLKGGILSYLEKTHNRKGNWEGECFVFDDRISVDHLLVAGDKKCMFCASKVSTSQLKSVTRGRIVCSSC